MTDQQRPSGYRGALPTRNDALARPWVISVIAIFVLMFVLALAGFPSSLMRAQASPRASVSAAPSASGLVSSPPTQ